MPKVVVSEMVLASPSQVYKLACDMERYPEFMEDVISVEVLERRENETVTFWVTKVDGRTIKWTERDTFDSVKHLINYELIKGDLKKFHGFWSFTQEAGYCKITLEVDFDLGIPVLAQLLNPVLTSKVQKNSIAMIKAIKEMVEQESILA